MMWLKNCGKMLICVNEKCFDNANVAGRYLMELSSQGKSVTVTRQLDMSRCFIEDKKKE